MQREGNVDEVFYCHWMGFLALHARKWFFLQLDKGGEVPGTLLMLNH
jgi:hypothetical protein